ncbi:MAG: hypothetical protein Q4C49_11395 [Bacillota bacterium]|nr:hypothetical protein [Bacillota bacterium]
MKKKILFILLTAVWMICVGAMYLFLTSLFTWKSMSALLNSIPFLSGGILLLVFCLIFVYFCRKHKILFTISTVVVLIFSLIISVFYFPFLVPHRLSDFEKQIENQYFLSDASQSERLGTWKGETVVAHSMGTIEGNSMAPSVEAFLESYEKGYRAMEVDFVYTSDNFLVCRHLWENPDLQEGIDSSHVPTLEQFKKTKILGKYTPLTFSGLCDLLKEYPDVWIVTDTKDQSMEDVRKHFCSIVAQAQENDALDVLDRFVIQAYSTNMVDTIREIYPFKNFIYATYVYWNGNIVDFMKISRWSRNHNVDAISMWDIYYCPMIQYIADQFGLDIYVHTVNSIQKGKEYINMGAKGIYSDLVLPSDIK